MADMIEIKHLNKYFGDLHVLKDINLTVKRGEKLVMIGPSGSGKSTLIRCVDYLEEPTSGEVIIDGTPLTKKNHLEMARKYSSMVFQQFNLYPNMTVLGNLTLAPIKLQKKSKEEANKRIYATTDKAKGALKNLANEEGYESFVVPDDVGGRFSVLIAVGLLPIAVSGADIDALMTGAADARKVALETEYEKNPALLYAAVRNILLRKGKQVEIVANYEPSLHYVSEWWKQLFGESEGKDQRGIFPAAVDLTTDLHSMGQFIQDGARIMFETVINVEESPEEIVLKKEDVDTDGMNYLAGKTVDFVNKSAMNGTILAHTDGNVPNLMVKVPEQNEFYLGELFYFFEFACGVSGYILGINPFNQPGVESYKKNMFALLGKPGYEAQREELLKRL